MKTELRLINPFNKYGAKLRNYDYDYLNDLVFNDLVFLSSFFKWPKK